MYQLLLTRKYLTSKVMPLLAVAAVSLSVATVLVTWSVMGGFLKTLMSSGRGVMGDVVITWPNVGFAHYDDEEISTVAGRRAAAVTDRAIAWMSKAAKEGARLLCFGETWLPAYPFWLSQTGGSRFEDSDQKKAYTQIFWVPVRARNNCQKPDPATCHPYPAAQFHSAPSKVMTRQVSILQTCSIIRSD